MVTRLIFLCLLWPLFLFSGEFTASVSSNQVSIGESFTLSLTLKDTSAKATPATDSLKNVFRITSEQQLFNTTMVGGQVTSSTTWKLTLIPHKEGPVVIPAIKIDTSAGILFSQPITIQVVKKVSENSSKVSDSNDPAIATHVSNLKPYKNEPFIYTVRITSKKNLANIQMQKIELDNAIVEMHGEPKISNKVVDGINIGIVEWEYLITPLKAGTLKVPSTVVQGMMPIERKPQRRSFFNDDLDFFSMMQGFDQLKPFALSTEETTVDILPAVADVNPWLPARSLKIEEIKGDTQTFQVGEPFTRSFKISAEGIRSSQLPSLSDLQMSDPHFKIYADKPELGDDAGLKSSRIEQYTIIPQQQGSLILPELSIVWWDTVKKEKVVAHIPSKTLQVMPAAENTFKSDMISASQESFTAIEPQKAAPQRDPLLYVVIAVLAVVLAAAILWAVNLQKKIRQLNKAPAEPKEEVKPAKTLKKSVSKKKAPAKDKREKLPDLNPT